MKKLYNKFNYAKAPILLRVFLGTRKDKEEGEAQYPYSLA